MSISVGLWRSSTTDAKLCAKVAAHETSLQEGVIKLLDGVSIRLNARYRIIVRINVLAEFGYDFKRLGDDVQDAVFRGIATATDLQVAAIHVRIGGVKQVNGALPSPEKERVS